MKYSRPVTVGERVTTETLGPHKIRAANAAHFAKQKAKRRDETKARNLYRAAVGLPLDNAKP